LFVAAALLVALLVASSFLAWQQRFQADSKRADALRASAHAVLTEIHSPPDALIGRVVDAETREPISQFRLMLQSWDAPQDPTVDSSTAPSRTIGPLPSNGRDGVFRIRSAPRGEWRLTIFALDHEPFEAKLVIADGATRTTAPLPLRRARTITGRVSDAADGSGIPGATVMFRDVQRIGAHWRTPRTARTSRDGWFIVDGVPPGVLRIDVHADGYAPGRTDLPAIRGAAEPIELSLSPLGAPRPESG